MDFAIWGLNGELYHAGCTMYFLQPGSKQNISVVYVPNVVILMT